MSVRSSMNFKFNKSSCLFFLAAIAAIIFTTAQSAHAAQCGYANGSSYSSAPQSVGSLCVAGTAGSVTGNGPWNWTCTDGGGTVNCSSGICGVNFEWRAGTFSNCDCSTSLQSRGVWCYRNGVMTDPDQSGCYANAGTKPDWQQSCTPTGCNTYAWETDPWTCSASCGGGIEQRGVYCVINGVRQSGPNTDLCDNTSAGPRPGWQGAACNTQTCTPIEPCVNGTPAAGQTQCPTASCFFHVSGGGWTGGMADASVDRPGEVSFLGNLVGPGDYPLTAPADMNDNLNGPDAGNPKYPLNNPAYPFISATYYTFDGIAIGGRTRVIVYSQPNFGGAVLFDQHGPYLSMDNSAVSNYTPGCSGDPMSGTFFCNGQDWATDWSGQTPIMDEFPPSTRHLEDLNRLGKGTSLKVICDP